MGEPTFWDAFVRNARSEPPSREGKLQSLVWAVLIWEPQPATPGGLVVTIAVNIATRRAQQRFEDMNFF